jgi:ketosteroid isomerase-like protein
MKKLLMIIPLVILLCFTFGCQQAKEVAEEVGVKALSNEDVAAIKETIQAFVKAGLAGDWDSFFAPFTEDVVWMWPNQPATEGLQALKELSWVRAVENEMSAIDIDGRDDLAYIRGSQSLLLDYEGAVKDKSKFLMIMRKQSNESWLISVLISNSDLPLPPPPKKE